MDVFQTWQIFVGKLSVEEITWLNLYAAICLMIFGTLFKNAYMRMILGFTAQIFAFVPVYFRFTGSGTAIYAVIGMALVLNAGLTFEAGRRYLMQSKEEKRRLKQFGQKSFKTRS